MTAGVTPLAELSRPMVSCSMIQTIARYLSDWQRPKASIATLYQIRKASVCDIVSDNRRLELTFDFVINLNLGSMRLPRSDMIQTTSRSSACFEKDHDSSIVSSGCLTAEISQVHKMNALIRVMAALDSPSTTFLASTIRLETPPFLFSLLERILLQY